MKNILKLIIDAIKIAMDKIIAKIPKKLSDIEIDVELGVKNWDDLEGKPFDEVDSEISEESENPVQNKVVKKYIDTSLSDKQSKNMIITLSSTTADDGTKTYSVDKTFEEITEAYNNGANLYVTGASIATYIPLYKSFYPANYRFLYSNGMSMQWCQVVISSDNQVVYSSGTAVASRGMYGGVRADAKTDIDTVSVKIGTDGNLYVPTYPSSGASHWDELEGKPFYEIIDENSKLIVEGDYTFTQSGSGPARFQMSNPAALLVAGEKYRVTIDSVQYAVTAENSNNLIGFIIDIGDSEIKIQNGSYYLEAYDNKYNVLLNRTIHVKIEQSSAFLQTIEDKFIPDSIARKADIQPQVQVDWNETNETSLSYIKNKPTTTALQSDWNESNTTATSFIKNKPQGLSNFENDLYWAKETKELVLEISDDYQGVFDANTYVCGEEWFCKENFGYELTLDGVTYTEKNSTIKEQNTNQTLTAAIIEIDGYGEICFFRDENGFYVYQIRIDNGIKEHLSGTIKFYSKGITLLSDTETVDEESLFIVNITQNEDKSWSSDKTFEEIKTAHESGKVCVAKKGMYICIMNFYSDTAINFGGLIGTNLSSYSVRSNGVVTATTTPYQSKIDTSKLETTNKTIVSAINELNSELDSHKHTLDVTSEVGQMIVVKAVDKYGKPTEWEAVDVPTGGASHWDDIEGKPFYEEDGNVVQYLPEKFIPTTIARTNDIQNYIDEAILGGEW